MRDETWTSQSGNRVLKGDDPFGHAGLPGVDLLTARQQDTRQYTNRDGDP